MFIITKIVFDNLGREIEREGYEYFGPLALGCGASSQQESLEASQAAYYQTLQQNAQQEFGQASSVFNDIYQAMSPIVAAGPNQLGYSAGELATLDNAALTGTSQAYTGAAQSVRQQEAAAGGSNFVPSGATLQINSQLAGQAAAQEGSELNQIQQADYQQGSQNYWQASGDLASATGAYNPATSAAGEANTGGADAANTANQIAQENNSWMQAVSGAIGGAGSVIGGALSRQK